LALRGPRSSRQRYRDFRRDYRQRRLEEPDEAGGEAPAPESRHLRRGKRREYLREYLRWLWPHRYAVGVSTVVVNGEVVLQAGDVILAIGAKKPAAKMSCAKPFSN
jgi:hypothetical protein